MLASVAMYRVGLSGRMLGLGGNVLCWPLRLCVVSVVCLASVAMFLCRPQYLVVCLASVATCEVL